SCRFRMTRPPLPLRAPCHAVTLNHRAPSAAFAGCMRSVTCTLPPGSPRGGSIVRSARYGWTVDVSGRARRATTTAAKPTPTPRGSRWRRTRTFSAGGLRARPMRAPITAPHTAPRKPHTAPSGKREACRERHEDVTPSPLGGQADRADAEPGPKAERQGLLSGGHAQRDELDDDRLDDVQREMQEGASEDRTDEQAQEPAEHQEEGHGTESAALADPDACRDQRDARREHDHRRLEELVELRDAEVELGLQRGHADEEGAGQGDVNDQHPPRIDRLAGSFGGSLSFDGEHPQRERRQRGAADHLDVGWTPQGHVLAE